MAASLLETKNMTSFGHTSECCSYVDVGCTKSEKWADQLVQSCQIQVAAQHRSADLDYMSSMIYMDSMRAAQLTETITKEQKWGPRAARGAVLRAVRLEGGHAKLQQSL